MFGPGLAAGGVPASARCDGTSLVLTHDAGQWTVPASALTIRAAGFAQQGLELSWQQDGGACALLIADLATAQAFLTTLPPTLHAPIAAARRARAATLNRRRLFGIALGAAAALAVLAIGAVFVNHATILDVLVARIPLADEVKLGDMAFEQITREATFIESGPMVEALDKLGNRLTAGSKYEYRFHLANDAAVNAFALPGGIVIVNRGLIEATRRPEQLAGVLAHEIQHVERRHSLQSALRTAGLAALLTLLTGDPGAALGVPAAEGLLRLKFSRDAEREADNDGFDLLVANDIDPRGMAEFFAILTEQGASPPALLSSHPPSDTRAQELAARASTLPSRCCPPLQVNPWPPSATSSAK